MSSFVHLHCHSDYSLLESPFRIPKILDAAEASGMSSVALTDNGVMYGVIDFYLQAKARGLKPIIGCEMYVAPDITVKERGLDRLILLCKDYVGYQNLIHLVTVSHLQGFYYKPRIDLAHLRERSEGLIAISPGVNGSVGYQIRSNRGEEARKLAVDLKAIYGPDFYLGIQKMGLPMEDLVNGESRLLGAEFDIPLVVTNDVYYATESGSKLRHILNCIQMGKRLEDDARLQFQTQEAYFKSPDSMVALFPDDAEAIANTVKIAGLCNLVLETDQVQLPRFECPDGLTNEAYLERLVEDGITKKYPESTDEIRKRVAYEMGVIIKMGYAPYFLIIYDFLNFCDRESIPVGPGRGSAAGSIIAYALNITRIDPLRYNLLFERFLNPERVSMPDVDLDFCIRRRGEVIAYIVQKYGSDCVSQIITFGTMASRGVIRDVGRVLSVPLSEVDPLAKLIPSVPGQYTSIPEAIEQVPELQKLQDSKPEIRELLEIGAELEGVSRHASTHAAGVVISRDPLSTVVPLTLNDGQVTTQYAMVELEKVGLLKMDILGLRNLTVMDDALRLIKRHHGIEIDLIALDLTDQKTYDLLCSGETAGIFQLEGRGMRQLIKDMKPSVFEDIIALLALYRPGPLGSGMVSEFVSNKLGETVVKYDLPELEPILSDTYGMIVYQEQVMQIASTVAGFSLGEADVLRRAMGKKKKSEMDKMRELFMDGAERKQVPLDKAKRIFDLCYKFAEYGFNKSHSAAYALISYQTAYLKANYPVDYMAALLSSVVGVSDKTSLYIDECKTMKIAILPPSIMESRHDFTVVPGGIRFGLGAIKNVGEGAIESIITQRESDKGPFTSLSDFCMRVDLRQVNKRVVESLIKTGAMDAFGERSKLLASYENVLEQAQIAVKERSNGQVSLFGGMTQSTPMVFSNESDDYRVFSPHEMLLMEKELLGLYISGHPLDAYKDRLSGMSKTIGKLGPSEDGKWVEVMGILSDCRRLISKNKQEMLVGRLSDFNAEMTVLVFQSDQFDQYAAWFKDDQVVKVRGRLRFGEEEKSMRCDTLEVLDQSQMQRQLYIDVDSVDDLKILSELQAIIRKHRGSVPVYLRSDAQTILTHRKYWVSDDAACFSNIEKLVGPNQVWFVS